MTAAGVARGGDAPMRVLDLFAGTGSSTQAFRDAGHAVYHVELDPRHAADLHADVTTLDPADVVARLGGRPDFVWASPPCQAFSVASIGRYWESGGDNPTPKHPRAVEAERVVRKTLELIAALEPTFWLMENPRGMLRKLHLMRPYRRYTVTYCQYGDERQKPTDLWGVMPAAWIPRPLCKPGASCHVAAPRGAKTGTQGRAGSVDRSRVPLGLSREVCAAVSGTFVAPAEDAPQLALGDA